MRIIYFKKLQESNQDLGELSCFHLSLSVIFHSVFYSENGIMNQKSLRIQQALNS